MNALPDHLAATDWKSLAHAYGSAEDIPALLEAAVTDTRGGHISGSPWFDLWSALCHQGDSYSASLAAVPHLVRLAALPAYRTKFDPLFLAACIEVSRLEGRGPELTAASSATYREALSKGRELAESALTQTLDQDSRAVIEGCVPAFSGDFRAARAIWDPEQ